MFRLIADRPEFPPITAGGPETGQIVLRISVRRARFRRGLAEGYWRCCFRRGLGGVSTIHDSGRWSASAHPPPACPGGNRDTSLRHWARWGSPRCCGPGRFEFPRQRFRRAQYRARGTGDRQRARALWHIPPARNPCSWQTLKRIRRPTLPPFGTASGRTVSTSPVLVRRFGL